MPLQQEISWRISVEAIYSKIDDEVVIMSLASDRYFGLDAVASRIWELLQEPCTVDMLCEQLMQEYEIDRETCQTETQAFLDEMHWKKLIEPVSSS